MTGDEEIIKRVLAGDREAYAGLVREHHARVLGLCRSILNTDAEAEDAAQESFLKAYKSLARFRGGAAFSTWIYRIAVNHCRDVLRRRARRRTESWDLLLEEGKEGLAALFDDAGADRKRLEDRDLTERVLACLSEGERSVLLLREREGFTYEEISQSLECSLDAVKARLRRARMALSEKLRHFMERENVG